MKTLFHITTVLLLALGYLGCAPGLSGTWDASGTLAVANAFDLDLTFESETKGIAVYATTDAGEKAVPVCRTRLVEEKVSFMIDTAGGTSCATLTRPLAFTGRLGHDVMTGQVHDAAGKKVGFWRAYRKPAPK